jgi:glycosyltransferase involved in cell wall biosynthesis
VVVIPTAIDAQRFCPRQAPRPDGPPIIGWIGSPSTTYYLERLLPVVRRLRQRHAFEFKVIGAGGRFQTNGLAMTCLPWRLEREVEDVQSLDIGIYPLPDDAWALGKGGFKTIQYMSAGIPVVASPVGVNRQIIRDGENGLLASTEEEWVRALSRLLEDADLRRRLGQAGRQTVLERYSTAVHAPQLSALLQEALQQ